MMVSFSIYFNKLVRLSLGRDWSVVGIRTVEGLLDQEAHNAAHG